MSATEKIKAELDRVATERIDGLLYSWITELQHLESIDVETIEARKTELRDLIAGAQAITKDGVTLEVEIPKQRSDGKERES